MNRSIAWTDSRGLYHEMSFDDFEAYEVVDKRIDIQEIITSDKAVIVFWKDGTKSVVKKMEGDNDDVYSAVAQALAKKLYESTTHFHKIVNRALVDKRSTIQMKKGGTRDETVRS